MRVLATFALLLVPAGAFGQSSLRAVPFHRVRITDAFWKKKIETNRRVTVEANLAKCEATGRIRNFAVAGGLVEGKHEGQLYNDSDVYKMLEGIAYTLWNDRDPKLEARADAIIDKIAAAQRKDGYLNTYVTLVKPSARWKNIRHGHELYCAGHLIEAAIAYYHATGKRKLLDVAVRFADLIDREFGPGARHDPPGHQEIELALLKLARETRDTRYFDLARFFLDQRGAPGREHFGKYCQDDKPVRDQRTVEGHAVRAMYQLCAMTDIAAATGDVALREALDAMWHDVVGRKMYVTGGIGDSASNEGFTGPFILPNDSAYAETCAAVGMALWNHRMFLMTGDGKYMDVVEREIYNGLISGVSVAGDRFFYSNALGSKGGVARVPWFNCSCCPTNVVRYVPAIGERVFAHRGDGIWVGLYMGASAEVQLASGKVKLTMTTAYPRDGRVAFRIDCAEPTEFTLRLRKPGWCTEGVKFEGVACDGVARQGFLTLRRTWTPGQTFAVMFPMDVRRVRSDPRVTTNRGRVALQRGPVVYCLEAIDHGGRVRDIALPPGTKLEARRGTGLFENTMILHGRVGTRDINAIPYHLWANRGKGEMVVWIPESKALAEEAAVAVRGSHCYRGDTLDALRDGRLPESSGDHGLPRMTWWPRKGSKEWVEYEFPKLRKLSRVEVYWFDDRGRGQCRVPLRWRLRYRTRGGWTDVKPLRGETYDTVRDVFNSLRFEPVTARTFRLEVELRDGFSGGILEWRLE